ncbi:PREDICTED: uncharacterized protein LOC106808411 [Priapulus caudatus]|uniref:Uncharacterized protein LOC106808411 n=1 Tax=Priapulus caudatus TaxID=37621 RepID=A0ABM1E343_PRICU|nr:PREDICTED: uncharacterized protein LOC106808411 [Priapulus caudatus]
MLSSSFADPFNVSIEISQVSESDNDDLYDSDYEPSFTVTAVLPDEVITATAEVPFEEMEFGMEVPDDDVGEDDTTEEVGPAIDRVKTEDDCTRITDDIVCLSFLKQIKTLANTHVTQCTHCSSPVAIEEKFVGSALYLKWICKNKHLVHEWCSQPLLNKRLHSIDFLIAASILTSGNNFHKMALWAEHLRLKFVSEATFHNIQRCYLVPTIENFWSDHQKEVVAEMKDKELVVLGDGRMDSPGYSAQYCSYTIMESESKKILTLKTLDKRVTDRKSTNMEKKGFSDALGEVMAKGLKVKEVVTDAHMAIGAFMRTQYPDVKHSNDVWHVAKNLGKKIISAGQQKGCESLQKWARDIINHFWFTCQKAQTYAEFLNIWRSVLNHVVNEHHWILPHGRGTNKCLHGPLNDDERDKPWLDRKADSEALATLAKIVLDKRFLNRVGYVLNFRSTSALEVFHNHILMYCAKRFAYTPPVYRARNLLAALDHNVHLDRPLLKNKEGSVVYARHYNKKSGRWTAYPRKIRKTYPHIRTLIRQALLRRLTDKVGMRGQRVLSADDPRRLSANLAPIAPPATSQLVEQHVSRFDTGN